MEDNLRQFPSGVEAEWMGDELTITDYNTMQTMYLNKQDVLDLRDWLNQILPE